RFSREDLLRAFDLLTRAEAEIRGASQPRYHLEMAILRRIYLRKLTPIEELIAGTSSGQVQGSGLKVQGSGFKVPGSQPSPTKSGASLAGRVAAASEVVSGVSRTVEPTKADTPFKDTLLAEIKKSKPA